jgi:tetratricopeptide (TPR) repeat protein
MGKFEQAIADHSRAIELKSDFAEAYFNRGVDYNESRQASQAIPDYTKAIELEPNYPSAYYARGLAYADTGDLAQAISDFDKALELFPDFARVYLDRSLAYYDLGNLEQAIDDLEQYLNLAPDAEDRDVVTNLIAQLQAQLSSAQAAPMFTKVELTLADFPAGFEAISPVELGLVEGSTIGNSTTIDRSFAFLGTEHFELVWGFTTQVPTRSEQVEFDAELTLDSLLAILKEGISDATIQKQEELSAPAGLGDASFGFTAVVAADDLRTRVDGIAFRKDGIATFIFVMYPDNDTPVISVGDVARKLASRQISNEISDISVRGDQ